MEKLITLTETSSYRYLVAVLPKDAYDIITSSQFTGKYLYYLSSEGNYDSEKEIFLGDIGKVELLGTISEIKEDIAREIVYSRDSGKYKYQDYTNNKLPFCGICYFFETALESLNSLVESKGVSIKENVIILIKCKK
jgi:hypothetical protein